MALPLPFLLALAIQSPFALTLDPPQADTTAEVKSPALLVGDPAPPLAIDHWGYGDPIEAFKEGRVYIVTICGQDQAPQEATLPWLHSILHQFPDPFLSLVTTTVLENKGPAQDSEAALHKYGPRVTAGQTYGFAGERGSAMDTTWCKAAERAFGPVTFVVDRHGKIAWIGDRGELRYLEPTLTAVLADQHKIEKLAQDYRAYIPTYRKVVALKSKVGAVKLESALEKNFDEVKELLELDPDRSGHFAGSLVLGMRDKLRKPDDARTWARTYFEGPGKNNTEAMYGISTLVSRSGDPDPKDLDLAMTVMKRVVLLTKESHATYLFGLGVLHDRAADLETGIVMMRKAVALAPEMEPELQEYEMMLAHRGK